MGPHYWSMKTEKLVDLLAAGRVANLPSVVSNVVTGAVIYWLTRVGDFSWQIGGESAISWLSVVLGCVVGCLLYLGGCLLNDWWDRDWDRVNKPARAIPSQRLSAKTLLILALFFLVSGLLTSSFFGASGIGVALMIALLILVYSAIHKKTAWGVFPMGLCRSGLYFLGYVAANPGACLGECSFLTSSLALFIPAMGVLAYIAGLSMLARFEAKGNLPASHRTLACFLLFLPVLTHLTWVVGKAPVWSFVSVLPFVLMVSRAIRVIAKSLPAGVSFLLASIPLLDFLIVLPLVMLGYSAATSVDGNSGSLGIIFAMIPLLAFGLALVLQRVAPAT